MRIVVIARFAARVPHSLRVFLTPGPALDDGLSGLEDVSTCHNLFGRQVAGTAIVQDQLKGNRPSPRIFPTGL